MKMKHINETEAAPVSGQHTPTPWQSEFICTGEDSSAFRISHDFGTAWPHMITDVPYRRDERSRADAAFIIRACNCHDELVKAVKDLLDGYEEGDENWQIEQARAALNKASRE